MDKNGGYRGSSDGRGGGGRYIAYQRNNLTRFMMHGKLTARGVELAAEKLESNRGRGSGSGPGHIPRRLGSPSQGLWGGGQGERRSVRMTTSWGIWINAKGKGVCQGTEGPHVYIKGPNPNYTFWSTLLCTPIFTYWSFPFLTSQQRLSIK